MPNDESSLTTTQREILTELQKILMTVDQLNDSLLKTIALAKEGGEMRRLQKEVITTGGKVFGDALGKDGLDVADNMEED
ncbi:uncharacterized protein LAJ45_04488 [Morchella importuna]|uniref:uncharacterized protein n=1 Tax=Morchella importuna TaxID=1174673 RepID=UPI001E8DA04C|nr:uncharacterized protein LAJ45_04488 [Morchella importuna]KAH8151286.1 hypothetical protein LAJ45_04488 [Morchella importuna]